MEILLRIDTAELASAFAALAAAGVKIDYPPPLDNCGQPGSDPAANDTFQENVLKENEVDEVDDMDDVEDTATIDELRPSWRHIDKMRLPVLIFAKAYDLKVECKYSRNQSAIFTLGRRSYPLLRTLWESEEWSANVADLWEAIYGEDCADKKMPPVWRQTESVRTIAEKVSGYLKRSGVPYRVGCEGLAVVLSRVESG